MGTTLHASVQVLVPLGEYNREHFDTVATFNFHKDYALSLALEKKKGHVEPNEWLPRESMGADRYQVFDVDELPQSSDVYTSADSLRYDCLLAVANLLISTKRVRVVFWRI